MTVRRRMTIAWLGRIAAVLALAGCGAGAAAQTTPQVPNFPDLGYRYIPPQIPAGVPHGTALAVDLSNVGRVRPPAMRLASDTTLSGAELDGVGSAQRHRPRHRDAAGMHPVLRRRPGPALPGDPRVQPHQGVSLVSVLRERHRDPRHGPGTETLGRVPQGSLLD